MTKRQFEKKKWVKGDQVVYNGEVVNVIQIGFVEGLLGLSLRDEYGDESDLYWVRYENVELIEK